MNPTHLETYIDGLQKTLNDKLFFVDALGKDFFKNKIIIDFGCGDGTVLEYIARNCNIENSYLFGVDIDERMVDYTVERLSKVPNVSWKVCCVLDRVVDSLKIMKSNREVVFIANSVFHELNDDQHRIYDFIKTECDYLIVRDMYVRQKKVPDKKINEALGKIVVNSNPKLFAQFAIKYGFSLRPLVHYLLKYTYVENWETELEENYLSVDWKAINRIFSKVVHDNCYIQKWRLDRVKLDFDIDLSEYITTTHRELILKKKKERHYDF